MFKTVQRIALLAAAGVVGVLSAGSVALAADSTSGAGGNGIRVNPVRTDLDINAGESRSFTLTVTNITSSSAEYEAIINDFEAGNNELGQPALILDDNKYAPSHSLKRYISKIPNMTIDAGESKSVKVVITVPKDAAAGGYYGAVRFKPAQEGNSSKNVSLTASVGSLILVKVPGDIKENVTLESFDVRNSDTADVASGFFTSNKNLYATARFKNTGNVHEQPFGKVIVKKGGKLIESKEINNTDPKGNVLPDSVRRFSVKLDKIGMWGHYTVEGNFGYGASGQLISGKTSFWVLPMALIIIVGIALVAIIGLVLWLPRAVKRYNQNVLKKANRSKR